MAWSVRGFSIPGLKTEVDLSAAQFRFVAYSGGMLVVRAGAGGTDALGVLQDNPDGDAVEQAADVMSEGVSKVVAGGTIADGAFVTSDAEGRAVTAVGGNLVLGRVIEGVTNAGELATIAINCVTQPTIFQQIGNAQIEDDAVSTAKIADDAVTTAKLDDDAVTTAKVADGAVTEAKLSDPSADGLNALRVAKATFDPETDAALRTQDTHGLGVTIPAGALILGGMISVTEAFTDAAGVSRTSFQAEAAEDLLADSAVGALGAGQVDIIPDMGAAAVVETTEDRELSARVDAADLTGGTAILYVYYVVQ